MENDIVGFSCINCHWAEQCGGDEICDHYDSLDDTVVDILGEISINNERPSYWAVWNSYCKMLQPVEVTFFIGKKG